MFEQDAGYFYRPVRVPRVVVSEVDDDFGEFSDALWLGRPRSPRTVRRSPVNMSPRSGSPVSGSSLSSSPRSVRSGRASPIDAILQRMAEFQNDGMAAPGDVTVTQMPASAGVLNGGGAGTDMFLVDNGFSNNKKGLIQQQQQLQSRGLHQQSAVAAASTQQSSNQSSSSSQVHSSSHSATASTSSRHSQRSQLMTHSMSASEMNVKQAAAALAASSTSSTSTEQSSSTSSSFAAESSSSSNRSAFGRSMSVGSANLTSGSLCGPRLAGGPQRVFPPALLDRAGPIISEEEPLVDMPDDDEEEVANGNGGNTSPATTVVVPQAGGFVAAAAAAASSLAAAAAAAAASSSGTSSVQFSQQKKEQTCSSSKVQVSSDGAFVAEKHESVNRQDARRLKTGDVTMEQRRNQSALTGEIQTESFSAKKSAARVQEQFQLEAGEVKQQEERTAATASVKVSTDQFSAEQAMAKQAETQILSSRGMTHQETRMASSSSSKISTFSSSNQVSSSASSALLIGANKMLSIDSPEWKAIRNLDTSDLDGMSADATPEEVRRAVARYTQLLGKCVERMRTLGVCEEEVADTLVAVDRIMRRAWAVPAHGHVIGNSLCDALRANSGLDQIVANCGRMSGVSVQFLSVRVLEQVLTTGNRAHVVETGLETVVRAARACSGLRTNNEHMRAGTGVLEHLFKHSESTCSQVIRMGGLDALVAVLKEGDTETLRHCAGALANLALYGGAENQSRMVQKRVPVWLFPLAMHQDDNIKYYACLAVAALVANKEIEADLLRSATLALVEPFIQSHSPAEFAVSSEAHVHGQSREWLQRLVPVLLSKPKEGHTLAAFHFAMEAGIKKKQGNMRLFHEIGAIEPLKKVASCPNALASRLAAQALRLIGEELPHKLSQQVPLWTVEDVNEWLKQIGFSQYATQFVGSRVDGDLLLQLTEQMLLDDIGITNGILRKRFMRELASLKKMTDYSSCDVSSLNTFLQSMGSDLTQYTYPLLNNGVDKEMLHYLTDEQLHHDCGIENSIHRLRIMDGIRACSATPNLADVSLKNLDVFISYRRSNGAQLASLLKVHLELKGFTVFIDVERLEAGKFDNNLLQSIRQAKHFILVLTPNALERCIGDEDNKDWVHREIVGALESQCNIIPITDNFQWPDPEQLPEDMRAVSYFNGVRWIHDYQDACVDKLERFLKGDTKGGDGGHPGRHAQVGGAGTPGTPSTIHGRQGPYVRSHSNESKGSVGSDKEAVTNGNAAVPLSNGPTVTVVE